MQRTLPSQPPVKKIRRHHKVLGPKGGFAPCFPGEVGKIVANQQVIFGGQKSQFSGAFAVSFRESKFKKKKHQLSLPGKYPRKFEERSN